MAKSPKKISVRGHAATRPARAGTDNSTESGARRPKQVSSYHHGALHEALLAASERILERHGMPGLTLRAAAREADVSHAAPTHHFGDLTGLLSELAAVGYRRFRETLLAAAEGATDPAERLEAMGQAYVSFSRKHPGLFTLMFRSERLDSARPALAGAKNAAFLAMAEAVGALRGEAVASGTRPMAQTAGMVRAWAIAHGLAVLLLDNQLNFILHNLPPGETEDGLLQAVLARR